jgi:uncharacterized protein (TIGR02117 family)
MPLRNVALALVALPLLYLATAVGGALVPRNRGWEEPSQGVLIYVRNNGVHVDLVLPASAAGLDLHRLVPPSHIADAQAARGWVAFGWGQREFYLETPRWADLTARNAARAVFGGDALMHVEHVGQPRSSAEARPLRLERQAYRRLVAAIRSGFAIGEDGRAIPLPGTGYADNDVFYEAVGHYSALRTSNQWTADVLADAGVKIGLWTPFAQGIMWRFRKDFATDNAATPHANRA